MDHQAGQSVSVGLWQLTDGLEQHGETVAIILDFYKINNTSHLVSILKHLLKKAYNCVEIQTNQEHWHTAVFFLQASETHRLLP